MEIMTENKSEIFHRRRCFWGIANILSDT